MAAEMEKPRRYFIKTYGCQMNDADSEKLAVVLENHGYLPTPNPKLADLILVNTCVVRQNAEDRAAGYITSLKGLKESNPNLKIALCGCLVTEPGRDIKKQFSHVDLFLPPNSPGDLETFLNSPPLWGNRAKRGGGEFVSIMTGCENFCSYCIVPHVRGREISRPMDEVLDEIRQKIEQGVTDITLLGQNVNSYKYGFAELLKNIHSLDIRHLSFVIRFMTSHPKDMSDEIIEAVHVLPYIAKEFHLPLQSGDDEILHKMNRKYTVDYFRGRVKQIRELMPQARITTDLMVGFPGETEEQFQNTLKAVVEFNFHEVYMFAYSSRPQTAAAKLPDQLPGETKKVRLQKLIETVRHNVIIARGG
jgi:tRNA-2-methylthio-N6-dimethylallyladenosine synthase